MKQILLFAFIFCINTAHSQIGKIQINEPLILSAIDQYIDKAEFRYKEDYDYLILRQIYIRGTKEGQSNDVALEFQLDSASFQLWAYWHPIFIEQNPPLVYTIRRDVPVLIYTGIEQAIDVTVVDKFIKSISKYLPPEKRATGSFFPEQWQVDVKNDSLIIHKLPPNESLEEPY